MTRRRNIVPFGGQEEGETLDNATINEDTAADQPVGDVEEWYEEEPERTRNLGWIAPVLGTLALLGWSAYFVWAHQAELLARPTPAEGTALIAQWAMPAALVVALWLLAMRNSRVEASRFADAAASLRAESRALEDRLSRVNSELSIAREFIIAQGRDLEALGRIASERLGESAGKLEALIADNSERVDRLESVSTAALDNMEKLRGQLPVVTNATRDLTNNIGQAGQGAHEQFERLSGGFAQIGEAGDASTLKIDAMRARVDEALGEFNRRADQLGEIAQDRFAALDAESAALRERMDQQEIAALAAVRARADELEGLLETTRARLAETEGFALANLRERLTAIETAAASLTAKMGEDESGALASWRERIAAIGNDARAIFGEIDSGSREALDAAGARVAALSGEISRLNGDLRRQGETLDAEIEQRYARSEDVGRGLTENLTELVAGLDREIESRRVRGAQASRAVVEELAASFAQLDGAIESRTANSREAAALMTESLRTALEALDSEIERRRAHSRTAAREMAEGYADELAELDRQMDERRTRHEAAGRETGERLHALLGQFDAQFEQRRARHAEADAALARHAEEIAARLGEYEAKLQTIAGHGREAEQSVLDGLSNLSAKLDASRESLAGTDSAILGLTDSSVRLLELIEASSRHAREALPNALSEAEGRLQGVDGKIEALRDILGQAGERGESLGRSLDTTRETTKAALAELEALHDTLQERGVAHADQLGSLRDTLAQARSDSEAMASAAEATLGGAIARLAEASREAVANIEGTSSDAVRSIAEKLAKESGVVVTEALRESTGEALKGLDEAVGKATAAARDAASELRAQLGRVDEITSHLEARIVSARRRAEEDIDDHFAKRVSQITESLNSTAIDIDKVLSAEVSDSAWQAYLKGERGIFTRRAVRLIDAGEAKQIATHYERDDDFREHVNRYIHDFEAMLRNLLATREGNSLAVTMLSSDMGKLYVAMAQAIERLRR